MKYEEINVKLELPTLITLLTTAALLGGFYYTTQHRLDDLEDKITVMERQVKKINRKKKTHHVLLQAKINKTPFCSVFFFVSVVDFCVSFVLLAFVYFLFCVCFCFHFCFCTFHYFYSPGVVFCLLLFALLFYGGGLLLLLFK